MSLAEQLEKLKRPQAGANLADARSRASVLFNPKEAATKDRATIFEIGRDGFQALAEKDSSIQLFESALFSQASMQIERAVRDAEFNRNLDRDISRFLQHLSPFFMLRPAHQCIEWLLRRFSVHEYNRDALMALILPYHETNMFVRVLQTMRLKDTEWSWLIDVQKKGVPLAKQALIVSAAKNRVLYSFICTCTGDAVAELGARPPLILLNFYATVMMGALRSASRIDEWHITALLETLLDGCKSDVADYVAATHMIIAQLVSRTALKPKLTNALVERIVQRTLPRSAASLLALIAQKQNFTTLVLSRETLVNLAKCKWLPERLAQIQALQLDISPLLNTILRDALCVLQREDAADCTSLMQDFLQQLVTAIRLSDKQAKSFMLCALDAYKPLIKLDSNEGEVIRLDDDDDDVDVAWSPERLQQWFTNFLVVRLGTKYSMVFDTTIKEVIKEHTAHAEGTNRGRVVKMALDYRLNSVDGKAAEMFEAVYHFNPDIRLHAVKHVIRLYTGEHNNIKLLQQCLGDHLTDDDPKIVAEILALPTNVLIAVYTTECLVDALIGLLLRAQQDAINWACLAPRTIDQLIAKEVLATYDHNLILFALVPVLFPYENIINAKVCRKIRECELRNIFSFLPKLVELEHKSEAEYNQLFINIVATNTDGLDTLALMRSVEQAKEYKHFSKNVRMCYLIFLLTASFNRVLTSAETLEIAETIARNCSDLTLKSIDWRYLQRSTNAVPTNLYSDFILALLRCSSFQDLTDWQHNLDDIRAFFSIYKWLSDKIIATRKVEEKQILRQTLKQGLDIVFKTLDKKLDFFLNFLFNETFETVYEDVSEYQLARVFSIKVLQSVWRDASAGIEVSCQQVLKAACALSSLYVSIRRTAVEVLVLFADERNKLASHSTYLLQNIFRRQEELQMESSQFGLVLFNTLQPLKKNVQVKLAVGSLQAELVDLLCAEHQPPALKLQLLRALRFLNNKDILEAVLPLAADCLLKFQQENDVRVLHKPHSELLGLVIARFEATDMIKVLSTNEQAWQLFEQVFAMHDVYADFNGKVQPLPCLILSTLNEETYEALNDRLKFKLIELIIASAARSDNDFIALAARKLFKRSSIQCEPLVTILQRMLSAGEGQGKAQRRPSAAPALDVKSDAWRQGIALLELLEHKRHLLDSEHLISPLFDLLSVCIETDTAGEYPKQLVLSLLHHCCQLAETKNVTFQHIVPESSFRIEKIVQCLKGTHNPQTQQNALLFLTNCAFIYPQNVLQNIIPIFTFMGTTVVRHDDAYSFNIINGIIESIVPILVSQGQGANDERVIPILRVFSDIMLDVPEHRRQPLYSKLIRTLGVSEYLWLFICVACECNVLDADKAKSQRLQQSVANNVESDEIIGAFGKRLEVVLKLAKTFAACEILEACAKMVGYIKALPTEIEKPKRSSVPSTNPTQLAAFTSAKQLRHYRYIILQFAVQASQGPELVTDIRATADVAKVKKLCQELIIATLCYLPQISELAQQGFWKIIYRKLHDILDNVVNLLSPEALPYVFNKLLEHELLSVRRKLVDVLTLKLNQESDFFAGISEDSFKNLFEPLRAIAEDIPKTAVDASEELISLQLQALSALRCLSKVFVLPYLNYFQDLLGLITEVFERSEHLERPVVASIVLALVDITANLKAYSLIHLPVYMPSLINILKAQADTLQDQPADRVCLALVTSVQKLFEALPQFLGPYVSDTLTSLATIYTAISKDENNTGDPRIIATIQKKTTIICSQIAKEVPLSILVPNCVSAYLQLIASGNADGVAVLMQLVLELIQNNTNATLQPVNKELCDFFLHALKFRTGIKGTHVNVQRISEIESQIASAFAAWTLKLLENTFTPIFNKIYKRTFKVTQSKESVLTFFRLAQKLSETLKSLFVPFARNLVGDITEWLNASLNQTVVATVDDQFYAELLAAILSMLSNILRVDKGGVEFATAKTFNVLVSPLVDQLENRLVVEDEALQQQLTECCSHLAVAVSSDILWKELNYKVLLKTRAHSPEVRVLAFNCCVEIARKLGEEFTQLLPETVPFIAELLEDENSLVEKSTRSAVQELEAILGESIQGML